MSKAEIVPSILSANLIHIGVDVQKVLALGCKRLQVDVMDGHFVPNISFGPNIVRALRNITDVYLEAHLMIERPDWYIEEFKQAGASCILIHQEAPCDWQKTIKMIKKAGLDAGIALRPKTDIATIKAHLAEVDMVLIMTVEPGFGGQEFMPGSIEKIAATNSMLQEMKRDIPIEVDGGINKETAPHVVKAGATLLVAGNAVFNGNTEKNYKAIQNAIKGVR